VNGRRRDPIRVGLVIGQLTAGGAEGQLWQLCRGLDRTVATPIVYCLSRRNAPYGPLIEATGVPVRVLGGGRLSRVRQLRHWLRADGVEVVHAWLFIANAYAWAACRGTARALATSARNCKRQGWLLDLLNRWAFRASDVIVANSREVARYVEHVYGAPPARITVVYNAIDLERFRPAAPRRGDRRPLVAMVGRLVAQKNLDLFVAAAAGLRERVPAARFLLVGDGPLRASVRAAVEAAGLVDCCELAGERHDVDELLRGADLFWLTSNWEGLPNAVIEAMACGLPVVATDVGGTRELVRSGEEGFLIRPGDRESLVTHSVALLTDHAMRARLARAARARAETFSIARMVGAMQDVYTRARQGRGA